MIKKISNVSTTLIVNTYECFYYGDNQDISDCEINISKKYNIETCLFENFDLYGKKFENINYS